MVFFFTSVDPRYVIFMGKDKYENEELIRYGFPEDIWFHVRNLSSAHVYIRLPRGQTIDDIPPGVLQDCAQLVKANSIQGNKQNNITVIYTPWSNLKKTKSMEAGQVDFHDDRLMRTIRVEKRDNATINRLNKTKVEQYPNLQEERANRDRESQNEAKAKKQEQARKEKEERQRRQQEKELRSYSSLMAAKDDYTSNQDASEDLEDDFM